MLERNCSDGIRRKIGGFCIHKFIKDKVGNEKETNFWIDSLLKDIPLKEAWPDLFRLESDKLCKVVDCAIKSLQEITWVWRWKRQLGTSKKIRE
ncbi:hypothetical protein HanRHA438_Chr00c11g0848561 [Helianthus annuus]|nr:hypothetical protein HanRHA438_Chr00c11g0848561 [Helianthus annuus]